jgi:hypothetical protein
MTLRNGYNLVLKDIFFNLRLIILRGYLKYLRYNIKEFIKH